MKLFSGNSYARLCAMTRNRKHTLPQAAPSLSPEEPRKKLRRGIFYVFDRGTCFHDGYILAELGPFRRAHRVTRYHAHRIHRPIP